MFVIEHLVAHGFAYLSDDVRLVVSELATNVGIHTDTPSFGVLISHDHSGVMIAVTDASPSFLRDAEPAELTDLSGRGLALTEALCQSWGVTAQPDGGKSVWASFELASTG
jgi:anti-sigma regulatory factor (Ser/Thr protein kinase)